MYKRQVLSWTIDNNDTNGTLTFYMDSKKKQPGFVGLYWKKGSTKPTANNIFGSFDPKFLQPWSAYYSTQLLSSSSGVDPEPGPPVQVTGTTSPSGTVVTYGTTSIHKPQFNNPVLSWSSEDGNSTSAELTFFLYNNVSRRFAGYIWVKGASKPKNRNIVGFIDPKYLQSWTGMYNTAIKQSSGAYKVGGPALAIVGGTTEQDSGILLGNIKLNDWNYSLGHLTWTDADNNNNGDIAFYISCLLYTSPSPRD